MASAHCLCIISQFPKGSIVKARSQKPLLKSSLRSGLLNKKKNETTPRGMNGCLLLFQELRHILSASAGHWTSLFGALVQTTRVASRSGNGKAIDEENRTTPGRDVPAAGRPTAATVLLIGASRWVQPLSLLAGVDWRRGGAASNGTRCFVPAVFLADGRACVS